MAGATGGRLGRVLMNPFVCAGMLALCLASALLAPSGTVVGAGVRQLVGGDRARHNPVPINALAIVRDDGTVGLLAEEHSPSWGSSLADAMSGDPPPVWIQFRHQAASWGLIRYWWVADEAEVVLQVDPGAEQWTAARREAALGMFVDDLVGRGLVAQADADRLARGAVVHRRVLAAGISHDLVVLAAFGLALYSLQSVARTRLMPVLAPRSSRISRGLCPACGYDLRGIEAGVCPECGAPRPPE